MFAAVGESLSLSCRNTSSVVEGGSVRWTTSGKMLPGDITTHTSLTVVPRINFSLPHTKTKKLSVLIYLFTQGSSTLLISKVTALHAGEYQCLGSTGAEKVLNTIRLYTLDGKSEKCQSKAKEVQHLLFCPRISSHVCLNSCFRVQAGRIQPHTILRAHVRSKMW